MEQVFIYALAATLACVAVFVSCIKHGEDAGVVGSVIAGLISALIATCAGALLAIRFLIECFK